MKKLFLILITIIPPVSHADDTLESIAICAAVAGVIGVESKDTPGHELIIAEGKWWLDLGVQIAPVTFGALFDKTVITLYTALENDVITWGEIASANSICSSMKSELAK